LNECAVASLGILTVETTALHVVHLPTFVPVSEHVGSFVTVYEPLKVCPVAAIISVSLKEHREHVLFLVPALVHVAALVVDHEPYECPNAGIVEVETVAPHLEQ